MWVLFCLWRYHLKCKIVPLSLLFFRLFMYLISYITFHYSRITGRRWILGSYREPTQILVQVLPNCREVGENGKVGGTGDTRTVWLTTKRQGVCVFQRRVKVTTRIPQIRTHTHTHVRIHVPGLLHVLSVVHSLSYKFLYISYTHDIFLLFLLNHTY